LYNPIPSYLIRPRPLTQVIEVAHGVGARVLIDACQSLPHIPVDVSSLKCDWLVGSSHKLCGPTGIGVLWAPYDLLGEMPPWKSGGSMVDQVCLDRPSTYNPPPLRFEAGTPPIVEAVGFGEACRYLMELGMENIAAYEADLAIVLWNKISESTLKMKLYGPSPTQCAEVGSRRIPLISFNHEHVHSYDLASYLDQQGILLRSGHHCAQPLHREALHTEASLRASLHFHNNEKDIDRFISGLKTSLELLEC
jgi:cysteine desulfurase / selenocysteine lyase